MSDYEKGPQPNWLSPLAGGLIIAIFGVLAMTLFDAGHTGFAITVAGVILAGYGLAKWDRVRRYGR